MTAYNRIFVNKVMIRHVMNSYSTQILSLNINYTNLKWNQFRNHIDRVNNRIRNWRRIEYWKISWKI